MNELTTTSSNIPLEKLKETAEYFLLALSKAPSVANVLLPKYMGKQLDCGDCPVARYLKANAPLPKPYYYKVNRGFAMIAEVVRNQNGSNSIREYDLEMPGPISAFIRAFDAMEYNVYYAMATSHLQETGENLLYAK